MGLTAPANTTFGTYKNNSATIQDTYRAVQVNATPFVHYYRQVGPVQLFGGAGVGFGTGETRSENRPTAVTQFVTSKSTNFSVSSYLEAGDNYFLTKRLSLQATAPANALPVNVGLFSMDLVYWTGAGSTTTQLSASVSRSINTNDAYPSKTTSAGISGQLSNSFSLR